MSQLPGSVPDKSKDFEEIMSDMSMEVPDHCGFSAEVIAAIALFKEDPTDDNYSAAEGAFNAQMAGVNSMESLIQEALDRR
jgi:hypothetical protein